MELQGVNLWAVLASTAGAFAVGGLWYSVLFGKAWARVRGADASQKAAPGLVYGLTFLLNLVSAFVWGLVFPEPASVGSSVLTGAGVGVGLVALAYAINYLGACRSPALIAIDAGFQVVRFTLFGLFFGLLG